ncbi:ARM repeat-containing protein [Serendipita vermifera]|nr:ARM repeat-containing protein [Serendipita vermifera]
MAFQLPFHQRYPIDREPSAEGIKEHFGPLLGGDAFLLAHAAEQIVKWLQTADPALISDALDLMVTGGIVKKFAELFRSSNPNLEALAGIVFGFLASGDTRHATIAFNSGILPACIERLSAPELEPRIKSAWILGNLAADDVECAESLLEKGVLKIMVDQMTTITNANEISVYGPYSPMLLWAINHFLKSSADIPASLIMNIRQLLCIIIVSDEEDTVLEESCYGLAAILQLNPAYGSAFSNEKICGRLVRLLQWGSNIQVQKAALQLVGAITARAEEYTGQLIRLGLLPALGDLLEHPLGEDTCWVISNIVADNVDHLNAISQDPRILPTAIRLLKVDASGFDEDEFSGRTRECCAILANIINKGQVGPIRHAVTLGAISALCTALRFVTESDALIMIMDALWKLIRFGESDQIIVAEGPLNLYLKLFETSGGFEGLERLERKRDRNVSEAAQRMQELIQDIINPPPPMDEDDPNADDPAHLLPEPANGSADKAGDPHGNDGVT